MFINSKLQADIADGTETWIIKNHGGLLYSIEPAADVPGKTVLFIVDSLVDVMIGEPEESIIAGYLYNSEGEAEADVETFNELLPFNLLLIGF